MDREFSPGQEAFREDILAFLRAFLPPDLRARVLRGEKIYKPEHQAWQRMLSSKGWLAPSWRVEYGGPGWGPVERFIFDEVTAVEGMPRANVPGIDLFGPMLIEFGNEAQKARFLPPILTSDDWWCQGFSEPNAGSDLAALTTKATRNGPDYVISGAKTWTSYGHDSNWMFAIVRTSIEPRKQAGLSFFAIPMDAPGVSLSPIITLGGIHVVNAVTLDEVLVPAENLIGEEGQAWRMSTFLLGHERLVGAAIGSSSKLMSDLKMLAAQKHGGRLGLVDDRIFSKRIARLEIDLIALKQTAYRVLADEVAGRAPGPEVSVLKLEGSRINQSLSELLMTAAGPAAMIDPLSLDQHPPFGVAENLLYLTQQFFDRRKMTIYGGSAEIQRNIIANRLLKT